MKLLTWWPNSLGIGRLIKKKNLARSIGLHFWANNSSEVYMVKKAKYMWLEKPSICGWKSQI
jgi:hypothetical protein